MTDLKTMTLGVAVAIVGVAASMPLADAANRVPYGTVGQHGTVMNNIYQAQQRNNAAISHVQNNIRANAHTPY